MITEDSGLPLFKCEVQVLLGYSSLNHNVFALFYLIEIVGLFKYGL